MKHLFLGFKEQAAFKWQAHSGLTMPGRVTADGFRARRHLLLKQCHEWLSNHFFTQQDRKHKHLSLGDWLVHEARKLGVSGATLIAATEGFGRGRKLHSVHFVELADQPVEVVMALDETDAERLFQRLHEENINVFYVKAPIEFGMTEERRGHK